MSCMDSGEGTGAEGTNESHSACAWGWKKNKGDRCYEEYTVHGGAENRHNVLVLSNSGRELHYLMIPENIEHDLFTNIVQSQQASLCDPKVDKGCLNLFHHHDITLIVPLIML